MGWKEGGREGGRGREKRCEKWTRMEGERDEKWRRIERQREGG